MIPVGFTIQPEERYLELLDAVIREVPDYLELVPETTWRPAPDGGFAPNGFHEYFQRLGAETGKPFVAHGVGFSLGSARREPDRDAHWLERIRADHELFQFLWYTDHLGVTRLDGCELTLPLPLPTTPEAAALVRGALSQLQTVVPDVGFENSVFYYHLGNPLDEPAWIATALTAPRTHLLLDVHNVYTTAVNAGFEAWDYIRALPFDKVIEIHLSGGSFSDPGWLSSGRTLRLDSHDHGVPDEVWALFERVLPRCTALRGVTLERMEGTVDEGDVPQLREELVRKRRILELARV